MSDEPMKLVFKISRDDLPRERIEEYKKLLNEMLGIDGDWEVVQGADSPTNNQEGAAER